jgi:hypothetical protein
MLDPALLVATQNSASRTTFSAMQAQPGPIGEDDLDLPKIVKRGGILYIWDGHHRALLAKTRGELLRSFVVDLDVVEA